MHPDVPFIETTMPADELITLLRALEPWRHEFHFSNGVKTSDLQAGKLFNHHPLAKLLRVGAHIPWAQLHGGHALDIGCNCGHNAHFLAQKHAMTGVGIDVVRRHLDTSKLMFELAGATGWSFETGDANIWRQADRFDLVMHFGTLYHLKHPLLSIECSFASLKPGGIFALETQIYIDETDDKLCLYANGFGGDITNWWMLGPGALNSMLEVCGFRDIHSLPPWRFPNHPKMARLLLTAKKP